MTQISADILNRLTDVIKARREADPSSSYVASLFDKGRAKIAQKVGEEATEVVIASLTGEGLTGEAADLLFHLMVLLEADDLSLADVVDELARREGLSGIEEKAGR